MFYIAIKCLGHGHQMLALHVEHFGNRELRVVGVGRFRPHRPATFRQPRVEFNERAKPALTRLDPDTPAAVLHVLPKKGIAISTMPFSQPEATLQKSGSNR